MNIHRGCKSKMYLRHGVLSAPHVRVATESGELLPVNLSIDEKMSTIGLQ